jgi:hypothetical protein
MCPFPQKIFFFAYINLESEQNQFLNFIIIDQCFFMEFENFKKASEITLKHVLAISVDVM